MGRKTVPDMAAELSALLRERLGVSGDGLEAQIARAGRRLPSRIRARATEVAEAEKRAANPRLARQVDPAAVMRAFSEVESHLKRIDAWDRRLGAVLGVVGSVVLGLIVLFVLLVTLLVWRGDL